jgi:hypothetical protein
MSKRTAKKDTGISAQLSLIDNGLSEGSFDLSLGLKQMLSQMLRGMDRWIVAAQISRATGKDLSKEMLDKILSSDPAYQPSALHVTAISAISGNLGAFKYLLEPLGSDVLDPADRDLIELARIQEKMKQLETEKMRILTKRGLK